MDKPHKKLNAWKAALEMVLTIYRVTEGLPRQEQYGLIGQMRRASLIIPSNIAEGAARQTKKEFINYLHMAQGSLNELDTQLELAKRLGYLSEKDWAECDVQNERIDKMISGLISRLRQASP